MNVQICNVRAPNSVQNTCICSVWSGWLANQPPYYTQALPATDSEPARGKVEVKMQLVTYRGRFSSTMHLLLETNRSVSSYAEITSFCAVCMAFRVLQVSSWLQYLYSALSMWILCCFRQEDTVAFGVRSHTISSRYHHQSVTLVQNEHWAAFKVITSTLWLLEGISRRQSFLTALLLLPYEVELDQVN